MFTKSLWTGFSDPDIHFPSLIKETEVDVVIIGGGITGITTAKLLIESGLKVAVCEAKEVGKGTTGHSTGNLYHIIDQLLVAVKSKYNKEILQKLVSSREEAFKLIASNVEELAIDCDYQIQSMFLYENESNKLHKEWETAVEVGIPMRKLTPGDMVTDSESVYEIPNQATMNPLRYVQGLAGHVNGPNCSIYENSPVTSIEEDKEEVLVRTASGSVRAKYVVHATHTPKGIEVQFHTVLGPYREYGVAVKLENNDYPVGIYWGYYGEKKFSYRTYEHQGEQFLICVGSPHKVGQAEDNIAHINELLNFLKERFLVKEVAYQWGGQHYKPADLLPYIGRKSSNSRQFVATGFATDGLIFGTLSARLITDEIKNLTNPYAEMFLASRHQPGKAAKEFLKENLDVAGVFIKDRFKSDDKDISEILPGEGKVVQKDNQKAAVYRDRKGNLSIYSALCSHMGCVVHWNNAEETWDCPCHGSRFGTSGDVIEGPAMDPLKKID